VKDLVAQQERTQVELKELKAAMASMVEDQGESKARSRSAIAITNMQDASVKDLRRRVFRLENDGTVPTRARRGQKGSKQAKSKGGPLNPNHVFG
jgi:hypothetical protein